MLGSEVYTAWVEMNSKPKKPNNVNWKETHKNVKKMEVINSLVTVLKQSLKNGS